MRSREEVEPGDTFIDEVLGGLEVRNVDLAPES